MAKKQTDPRLSYKQNLFTEGSFIGNKTSKFQPEPPGTRYYIKTRHIVGAAPANSFLSSFNSQIVPTILPGVVPPGETPAPPVQTFRLLNESGQPLLTEFSNNLRTEQ